MSKPPRNADGKAIVASRRTFLVSSSAWQGRNLLQSDRMAGLLIEVLYSYRKEKKYLLHEFVVMPNHLHALFTVDGELSVERAVQLIKGGFSYRAKRELGYGGEIWQKGFSDHRVRSARQFLAYRDYIHMNPVKAGLAASAEQYPYGSAHGFETDPYPSG